MNQACQVGMSPMMEFMLVTIFVLAILVFIFNGLMRYLAGDLKWQREAEKHHWSKYWRDDGV